MCQCFICNIENGVSGLWLGVHTDYERERERERENEWMQLRKRINKWEIENDLLVTSFFIITFLPVLYHCIYVHVLKFVLLYM